MNEELKKLLIKVRDLYTKYGIKSMTMDDVARELGMSKKTLYQYVQNKDELVLKVCELYDEEKNEIFREIVLKNLNAIESLMHVNKLVSKILKEYNPSVEYDLKKYHPEVYFQVKENNHSNMYNAVLQNLKNGKKEGLYRSELDEELIAKLYVSRINSLSDSDVIKPEDMKKPGFMQQLMEYHIRGIANENGIKELEKCKKSFINEIENK
ncbi:TetR/AcrR family transcriptional regulator [Bacteroidota bacterium]